MGTDYNNYMKNVNKLIELGYRHENFAYQIGNGEDENDMDIFIKDGIALMHDYTLDRWYSCKYDNLNYVNGWDYDNQEYFNIGLV